MIPKIDTYASSGGTPSRPVNENFYYNAFYFVYDQDKSINPPFGYEIQDASLDAFFSAAYNDFVAMSASFGQLLNWSLSQYLDLLWNTLVADYYATSGQAVEFAGHLWSDNATVYYYLVEDDGELFKWAFDILGITVTLYLDQDGLVYSNGKGQPNGNVKNDDSLLNSLGKAQRDQTSDGKIYRPVKVSLFDGLPAPYFTGTTINLTWFDASNTKHLFQITNFQRCILGITLSYNQGNSSYYFIGCYYDMASNPDHSYFLDGSSVVMNFTSAQIVVPTDIGNRTYIGKAFYPDIKSGNLPSIPINILNASWNTNTMNYLIANNKGILNRSLVAGTVPSLWLDYTYYYPVENPQDVVVPVDTPISLPDLDDWVIENDPEDDPTSNEDPVPVSPFEPEPDPDPDPTPIPTAPLPPLVSGNDDLWSDMNGVFEIESEIDGFLGGLSNFEFTPLRTLVEGFSSSLIWVSTIMMALYNGSDFSILFVVLSIFFIAAALLGIYKWWTH